MVSKIMRKNDTIKSKVFAPHKRGRGRPPKGADYTMSLRLAAEVPETIDGLLYERESRSDFIRSAIDREIARRKR